MYRLWNRKIIEFIPTVARKIEILILDEATANINTVV